MADLTYEEQLQKDLKAAQTRVEKGVAAKDFLNTSQGKIVQDWINERISYLMEKMTGKDALTDREYLSYHGAVRELKDFNVMLQQKAASVPSAVEEVKILNGQQSALEGQSNIQFGAKK